MSDCLDCGYCEWCIDRSIAAAEEAVQQNFNGWSFVRDVLVRGAAIEQDTRALGRGYEQHSFRLDAAARELAGRLEPHLVAVQADDAEQTTAECLRAAGFAADPPLTALTLPLPTLYGYHSALAVDPKNRAALLHRYGEGMVPVAYPETRGHVRRLCAALGVSLKEPT